MGMEIRRKRVKKLNKANCKGSTMVETLVSFVVLFMVLASLYSIVSFSSELFMKSVDISRTTQKFYREIYKSDEALKHSTFLKITEFIPGFGAPEEGKEHAGLMLSVEIDEMNFEGNPAMKNSTIKLDNVGLTSYVCTDEDAVKAGNALPKAVMFEYKD